MALKHLLNHDDSNEVYQNHHSFLSWSDHGPLSECIPTLPTQPWEQCVSEILGSQSLRYDMVQEEFETDLFESLEEANSLIKSWATGHPPCQTTVEDASQGQAYICYGTLVRSPIKLCGDMMVLSRKLNNCTLAPIQGHTQMVVTKIESQHVIAFSDGVVAGEVNAQLEKALCGIAEQGHELEFEVFAPVKAMLETIGRATKGKDAIIRVQINLYGPRNAASDIGKELSSHKLYLQDPGYIRDEIIYDNPHILKLPGFDCLNAEVFPPQEGSACHKAPPEALETAMKDVYSSLTRDHNLQALEGDKRLQTCLLPHQGTALDFMKQRENGPIPPGYRLWELTEEAGVSCYRHVITNTLCMFEPEETGGGILADEMGMGKTLCVLALTLESLSVAQDWVVQNTATGNEPPEGWRCRPRCKATLIVASSDLMINEWFQELEKHFDRTTREALRTIKYHGPHRHVEAEILQEADIIVTTYHTLAADLNREKNTLKDMEWYRLVLDEAHIIRRQSTVLYRTVAEIAARSRWCLTGTPVQNRLEDIGSLFAFLRIQPFHSLSNFRKSIAIPFDEGGKRRSLSIQRFARLLDSCCLRRTKEVLHLPNEQHRVRVVHLSPEERAQYDRTHDIMFRAIRNQNAMFDQNSTLGMFQVQLQLRIICNHGTWQQPFSWNRRKLHLLDEREAMEASLGRNGEITCSGCREIMPLFNSGSMYRRFEEHCSHVLCIQCLGPSMQSDQESLPGRCPLCRPLWNASSQIPRSKHTSQEDTYFRADGCSSKMEALMRDISYDVWNTKSIIFTCWTRTLDLLEFYLRRLSSGTWIHERIDGECSTGKRERILRQFTNNPNLRVLIITTGTGAVGLNLATANRIFIFEPQWNPSVENQAVARALRLGQKQAVLVTRYVVEDTVEQTMRKLQDTKLQRANLVQSG